MNIICNQEKGKSTQKRDMKEKEGRITHEEKKEEGRKEER